MSKWVLFSGMIIAGVVLYQVKTERLDFRKAFDLVQVDSSQTGGKVLAEDSRVAADQYNPVFDDLKNLVTNTLSGKKVIGSGGVLSGAILPANPTRLPEISSFFAANQRRDVETFVILTENRNNRGRFKIAFAETGNGFNTSTSPVEPDLDLINKLLPVGVKGIGLATYNVFLEEKPVFNLMPFIKQNFPKAKVLAVAIKDSAQNADLDKLISMLQQAAGSKKIVVLATTDFAQKVDETTANFHDELARNAIENFDQSAVEQMDLDSKPVIYTLLGYMKAIGGQKTDFLRHFLNEDDAGDGDGVGKLSSSFLATFVEGEANYANRKLTILAFGDIMMSRDVRTKIDNAGNLNYVLEKIQGYESRFFKGADVVFGNLEGPIVGQGKKGGTEMNFAFNEDVAPFLKYSGFNLVSISNNHSLDQGSAGRKTTIEALDKNDLAWCGHPHDADPESVYYSQVGDKKFAFVCFHDAVQRLDRAAAVNLIKEVRPKVDYLIVSIHWGIEYKHQPDQGLQVNAAHEFIDAGADFIIGHHPHVAQTFEVYKGRMVFYSLGNFVFDQYWSKDTQEELGIGIVLDESSGGRGEGWASPIKTKVYLFPMKSVAAQSRLMNETERKTWLETFIGYGNYSDEVKEQIRDGVVEVN